MDDKLAVLAVDLGIDDLMFRDLIEIVGVVRSVLEPPLDLAVTRADREHTRRPLVVAGPIFRIPVGPGIADALVDRVGLSIIGAGFPDRAAAVLPALLAVLPGLVAGLAGARDGVGPPHLLAGVEVDALDESADAELATGGAGNADVTHCQRRQRDRLADGRVPA